MTRERVLQHENHCALTAPSACLRCGSGRQCGRPAGRPATSILQRFRAMPEHEIPHCALREAKGLAILTVTKGGLIWSGKIGQGVVIARNWDGWSGQPSYAPEASVSAPRRGQRYEICSGAQHARGHPGLCPRNESQTRRWVECHRRPCWPQRRSRVDTNRSAVRLQSQPGPVRQGITGRQRHRNIKANHHYCGRDVAPAQILAGRTQAGR